MVKTATINSLTLQQLARGYGRVLGGLYAERKIAGKLERASRGARHLALGVRLADPLALDTALSLGEPLALACRSRAVIVQRAEGLVYYQVELARRWWKSYTRQDVTGLGLGFAQAGRQVDFSFDAAQPHSLVAGTTGAGKSTAIASILAGLFSTFDPGELRALVVDPHRDYLALASSAHLAGPLAHEPEEWRAVLAWASRELTRRVASNDRAAPWVFVVVDEARRALADPADLAVAQALASEGRKYKLSLIIGVQELKQRELPGLVGLLPSRWIGRVTNARISADLSGLAGLDAHRLSGSGDFWHVSAGEAERLQVAQATAADLAELPRVVEVPALDVDPLDGPPAFDLEEAPKPGRPSLVATPAIVANYLHAGPGTISRQAAREQLGLSRGEHEVNQTFARGVQAGLDLLENERG